MPGGMPRAGTGCAAAVGRSLVEGLFFSLGGSGPSTALRAVPLPSKSRGGYLRNQLDMARPQPRAEGVEGGRIELVFLLEHAGGELVGAFAFADPDLGLG